MHQDQIRHHTHHQSLFLGQLLVCRHRRVDHEHLGIAHIGEVACKSEGVVLLAMLGSPLTPKLNTPPYALRRRCFYGRGVSPGPSMRPMRLWGAFQAN